MKNQLLSTKLKVKRENTRIKPKLLWTLCMGACLQASIGFAQEKVPQANIDAPSAKGVMVGFPPEAANQVNLRNAMSPRFMRWTMQNISQVYNTARVSRGDGPIVALPQGQALDVEKLNIDYNGKKVSVDEFYRETGTDALLVMHDGKIVFERYIGDMKPTTGHSINSCTKSFVGTLAAMLANEGKLDLNAPASKYVPELKDAAVGSATLQQLLDMRANFKIGDKIHEVGSVQVDFMQALGVFPRPANYAGPDGIYQLMESTKPTIPHGTGPVRYDNASTETIGWVLSRVTGKHISELISEKIWIPIGAQQDADFALDTRKFEIAAFGMQSNARDMARFGELMRNQGRAYGKQVIPASVVADIERGGNREAFAASPSGKSRPTGSYHNFWWLNHDKYDSYQCNGQFGQRVWIAPKAKTVIVQLSTDPDASGTREPLRLAAYRTIAEALGR